LAAACRKVSLRATVAQHKRNVFRKIRTEENCESSKEFVADGVRKGPGCENGIRRWDVKEPPHMRTWRKTASSIEGMNRREQPRLEGVRKCNDIMWKTFRLEIVKRANEMSSGLQKVRKWTLWRGRPPPKQKKKLHTEQELDMWDL
jgi:hypothetical protein